MAPNKKGIWRVYDGAFDYYAELVIDSRATDYREVSAHCKACTKVDLMTETGIPADIRGWTQQGMCGAFLKALRISLSEED